jgi:hypothetical protein
MCSWKHCLLGLLLLTAFTAFLLRWIPVPPSGVRLSGPQEIEEVVAIARQLGLQCCGDREDGQVQMRLLVSQAPLSWEFANGLAIGPGKDSDWIGTVAVIRGQKGLSPVPHEMRVWGRFLLYGDPALIARLTGRTES